MRPTGAKWYRGYGAHRQEGQRGQWGAEVWGIGNEAHRGYGVQGYGPHGQ